MKGDHDLSLQIFVRNFTIAIVKFLTATCCSSLASEAPAPHLSSNSPSPKSSRRTGGRGRRAGGRWLPQQPGLHSYILLHSGTKLTVVLHRAADRSGSSKILEADWLQNPAVVLEFR